MKWDDLIEKHSEIEKSLEHIREYYKGNLIINANGIKIKLNEINAQVNLHESQLTNLEQCQKADKIPSLKYIGDYGIKFKNLFEICISIESDHYSWIDGHDWKTDPLKFKIGKNQFIVRDMSPLMVLLTEPVYREYDYFDDFHEFATITMILDSNSNYKEEFSKAIYYLNSHYLKPINFYAKLRSLHFDIDEDDPLGLFNDNPDDVFKVAKRERNIRRTDFKSCLPLRLYNNAKEKIGEQRFLSFYRVLEFFMKQALLESAKEIRYDRTITEEELINTLSIKTELDQLENLLKRVISTSRKSKLMDYCMHHKLIPKREFKQITRELYRYRNAMVHAKETEINTTNFPDPFETPNNQPFWNYIVAEFAQKCIKQLNEK